jgi:prepilin signal peptidase PulO-like enzyme (type II secretory pathway)
MLIIPIIRDIPSVALAAMPDVPPTLWWLPLVVILVLGLSACVDAMTARIPDGLIFLGLLAVTALLGIYVDWPFAAAHLRIAIAAGVGLWFLNILWVKQFGHDAFGMGDAKWTMLAVDCFGIVPALCAWGIGACLGVVWMGLLNLSGRRIKHVYFGPFLFVGLMVGIYWLRIR